MKFSGCGVVRNWTVVATGRGGNGNSPGDKMLELQLFHPDSTHSTVFTKVTSSAVITNVRTGEATHTFTGIDFTFSSGDIPGFYFPSTGEYLQVQLTLTRRPHFVQVKTNPPPGSIVTVVPQALTWVPLMSVASELSNIVSCSSVL